MRTSVLLTAFTALLAATLPVAAHGAVGLVFVEFEEDGVGGVNGLSGVESVVVTPDGRHVYAAGTDEDSVAAFARDSASGALVFIERHRDGEDGVEGLDRPRSVTVSPDGAHVYVASAEDDAVVVFARDGESGRLDFVEFLRDGSGADGIDGAIAVVVSGDGRHVYVAGNPANAIAVFGRDESTGRLQFLSVERQSFERTSRPDLPRALALSPDGAHLYVTAVGRDGNLVVFARDAVTGALTFVERETDEEAGVDGLDGSEAVAVSPDGAHVYAVGDADDALAVFARDPATGALTFIEKQQEGIDDVDGLESPQAIVVGRDGLHVYVVSRNDNAVAVFDRNTASGRLTFVQAQHDGDRQIDGLRGGEGVALSPDGAHLYAAAATDDALVVFGIRCGNGAVDAGEICDDGGIADGDGCSGGCRRECASDADCDDANVCTEDACRANECFSRRCGIEGSLCALNEAAVVLEGDPQCAPIRAKLRRTIRRKVNRSRRRVLRVEELTARAGDRAFDRVDELLSTIQRKADKLAERRRVSDACRVSINRTVDELQDELELTLKREGTCRP